MSGATKNFQVKSCYILWTRLDRSLPVHADKGYSVWLGFLSGPGGSPWSSLQGRQTLSAHLPSPKLAPGYHTLSWARSRICRATLSGSRTSFPTPEPPAPCLWQLQAAINYVPSAMLSSRKLICLRQCCVRSTVAHGRHPATEA